MFGYQIEIWCSLTFFNWQLSKYQIKSCIVCIIINHDAKTQSMYLTFFLLTKTSRGLECNPYIQNFDHPLQNTTKYVVLHFCCCEFPKSYSILTWWDVCYVLSHSRNHAIFKWCDFSPFHRFFISGILWIFNWVTQK